MYQSTELRLNKTLWLRKITVPAIFITLISLILIIEHIKGINQIVDYSYTGLIVGVGLWIFGVVIQNDLEERNSYRMINWAKRQYGLKLSAEQASELIQFGTCEFNVNNNVIELCLVERKGKFFLHTTTEIDFKEV